MKRIYDNPGLPGRPTLSIVIVVLAFFYGWFELWNAWRHGFSNQIDLLFALLFLGGGIYGFNVTWNEARDAIVAIDVDDDSDRIAVSLWRPFGPKVIDTRRSAITNWRHFVKLGPRNTRTHLIHADCAAYPRPLRLILTPGQPVPEGLRALAPDAVAEYEDATRPGRQG